MKALKEKRIRLRSLWRRGLVILSLFALVFASCNNSGSGEEEIPTTDTRPVVKNAEIVGDIAEQYEGTAFDTSTLSLKVTYEGGDTKTFKYPDVKFVVEPSFVGGVVVNDLDGRVYWLPVTEYTISSAADGKVPYPAVLQATDVKVWPIMRGQVSANNGNGNRSFMTVPIYYGWASTNLNVSDHSYNEKLIGWQLPTLDGYIMSSALNVVGNLEEVAYVDQKFDASSFRIQATYANLQKKDIPVDSKQVKFQVRPYYLDSDGITPGGTRRDIAGPGDVLVTVGKPILSEEAGALYANQKWFGTYSTGVPGVASANKAFYTTSLYGPAGKGYDYAATLTALHPLKTVYHVANIEVTQNVEDASTLPSIYYWQADNKKNWLAGGLKDVPITVNYVGDGASPKNTKVGDLDDDGVGMVWYNDNPYYLDRKDEDSVVPNRTGQYDVNQEKYETFGAYGVRKSSTQASKLATTNDGDGLFYNKITNPTILINYRGATTEVKVDIWTKVESIQPVYKNPNENGYIWVDAKQLDNDVAGKDAKWYSDQVNVYALMSSQRGQFGLAEDSYTGKGKVALNWCSYNIEDDQKDGFSTWKAGIDGQDDGKQKYQNTPINVLSYGMNFGQHPKWDRGANDASPGEWSDSLTPTPWGQVNNAKYNNGQAAVTFYFLTPWSTNNNMTQGKLLKNSLTAGWLNIRTR